MPWLPSKEHRRPDARIVQIGEDPLYARYPMRSFPSDLTITATALSALEALEQALADRAGRACGGAARAADEALGGIACGAGATRPNRRGAATRTRWPG